MVEPGRAVDDQRGASTALWALGFVVAIAVLLVVGSVLFWSADGRPRSPEAFRTFVADTGLEVEWANNGPRGGDGTVESDCGTRTVAVDDLDDVLWIRWDDQRAMLTSEVIDRITACE